MQACGSLNQVLRTVCRQSVLLALATVGFASPLAAQTNPTGGVAVQGQAAFATTGNHLQVTTQNGAGLNHSAINWQSFSIPAGSSTWFQQPSASSTSINRVVTSTPSLIFGSLGSNGNLVLVNQSGITVGAGAVVDTAGFTASALRMGDADALSGRLRFGAVGEAGGAVSVNSTVLARSGDVVLLGSRVDSSSQALLQAPNGSTILAAGQQIEITGRGLEGIVMQVQAPSDSAVNLGTLSGNAVGIFAGTLKHSGMIQANQVSTEGGRVVLKAAGDTIMDGNSRILATNASGKGGQIQVLGQRVAVTDNALLDASGTSGGGTVLVGGDYQGKNAAVQNATVSYLGAQASIKADATVHGDGGNVIVWSDDTTRAYGSISARGGPQGGNGGLVETSGHRYLDVGGIQVSAAAPKGQNGKWLLDPTDITVVSGSGTSAGALTNGVYVFSPPDTASSTIMDGTINATLAGGTDVTLLTQTAGTGGSGDIVLSPDVVIDPGLQIGSANRVLTLQADRDIVLQGTFSTSTGQPYVGSLTVNMLPGQTQAGQIVSPGNLVLNGAGGSLVLAIQNGKTWSHTGTVNILGSAAIQLADANANAGTFQNNGVVNLSGNSLAFFSDANGADNGVIRNDGTINVGSSTSFEAEYHQTGMLNVKDADLFLQNVQEVSGTIDLAPTGATTAGSLSLVSSHGNAAAFSNLTILSSAGNVTGPTQLFIGSNSAPVDVTFSHVNAPGTQLTIGASDTSFVSNATVLNGDAAFNSVSITPFAGHLALSNGHLGITGGSFVTPDNTEVSYSGDVGYGVAGDLTVAYDINTTGNVWLIAGWNKALSNYATSAANPGSLNFGLGSLADPVITTSGGLKMEASGPGGIDATRGLLQVGGLTAATSLGGPVTLDNAGNTMASFKAMLSGAGDLTLVNQAPLDVQGITVAAGNVDIDNTGAFSSSGAISAPAGSISIQTHSPLTIANTVDANGNITLSALSPDGSSNVTLNGAMASAEGGISVQAYNNFIQNSRLSAALAIDVRTLAGSLQFGPSAFSVGNPVSYSINGVSYQPPWITSTLTGGPTSFVVAFLDQFQAALDAQFVLVDDPLGLRRRGREGVVVEGEICTP